MHGKMQAIETSTANTETLKLNQNHLPGRNQNSRMLSESREGPGGIVVTEGAGPGTIVIGAGLMTACVSRGCWSWSLETTAGIGEGFGGTTAGGDMIAIVLGAGAGVASMTLGLDVLD
jgi:hypothetical protein